MTYILQILHFCECELNYKLQKDNPYVSYNFTSRVDMLK